MAFLVTFRAFFLVPPRQSVLAQLAAFDDDPAVEESLEVRFGGWLKSGEQPTWDGAKTRTVNNGIDYQPQLVKWI